MTMRKVVEYYPTDTIRGEIWTEIMNPDRSDYDYHNYPETQHLRFSLVNSFSMIDYAACHWIKHAKLANSFNRSTIEGDWPFELWTSATFIEMESRIYQLMYYKDDEKTQWYRGPTVMPLSVRYGLKHVIEVPWDRAASTMATTGSPSSIPNFGAITSTLIEEAARGNHEEIVRLPISGLDNILLGLARFPVAYNLPWRCPRSPVSWAAWHGNLTIAKLLCDNGLVHHPDHISHALAIAAHNGHMSMAQFLLDQGAAHHCQTLYQAFECGNEDIVRLLLDKFHSEVLQCGLASILLEHAVEYGKYSILLIRLPDLAQVFRPRIERMTFVASFRATQLHRRGSNSCCAGT